MDPAHSAHFGTLAIHAGQEPDQWNPRTVLLPVVTSRKDRLAEHRVSMLRVMQVMQPPVCEVCTRSVQAPK